MEVEKTFTTRKGVPGWFTPLSEADRDEFEQAYKACGGLVKLAAKYGSFASVMSQTMAKLNISVKKRGARGSDSSPRKGAKTVPAMRRAIVKLRNSDETRWTFESIGRLFGVSRQCVQQICAKAEEENESDGQGAEGNDG